MLKSTRPIRALLASTTVGIAALTMIGCSGAEPADSTDGKIVAVAAENTYGDVLAQIGGSHVEVHSIMTNPNTDPHSFEANTSVAKQVSQARLLIQNGLGYDDFMTKIEKANPSPNRKIINAQQVRGLPDNTPNPHLWYDPETMPAVADAIAQALGELVPAAKAEFEQKAVTFKASLQPWRDALAAFAQAHPGTPVAVTEPVADYLLKAGGVNIRTPWSLEAAVMNDTDPAATDLEFQNSLITGKQVKALIYNQQVNDNSTKALLDKATAAAVPVVAVYETMPEGFSYQDWMLAEVKALSAAVTGGTSTESLSR
ncbi:MAG: zinc ABC transporter substrate-binding protein [Gordonia sp. (in: high G+C Gram-positive bacteria)]|uniref:metal ABC transporter solute-binding protein, Zn/Mn family n=1 Tax=Gordonia sp. (in: high G+C Gram-positive bacteria) TaxID=84139 RepID=UPI0039E2EBE2